MSYVQVSLHAAVVVNLRRDWGSGFDHRGHPMATRLYCSGTRVTRHNVKVKLAYNRHSSERTVGKVAHRFNGNFPAKPEFARCLIDFPHV